MIKKRIRKKLIKRIKAKAVALNKRCATLGLDLTAPLLRHTMSCDPLCYIQTTLDSYRLNLQRDIWRENRNNIECVADIWNHTTLYQMLHMQEWEYRSEGVVLRLTTLENEDFDVKDTNDYRVHPDNPNIIIWADGTCELFRKAQYIFPETTRVLDSAIYPHVAAKIERFKARYELLQRYCKMLERLNNEIYRH